MTVVALSSSAPTDERRLKERVHRRLVDEGVDDAGHDRDALRSRLAELLRAEQPLLASARGSQA